MAAWAIGVAAIAFGLTLPFFGRGTTISLVCATLLDFLFLSFFVLVSRSALRWLDVMPARFQNHGKRVLIYGTGEHAQIALRALRESRDEKYVPVGFLDEDPLLEGKSLLGYRIFGGHWHIPRLKQKFNVDEILVASQPESPLLLKRLRNVVANERIQLRSFPPQTMTDSPPSTAAQPAPRSTGALRADEARRASRRVPT